MYCKNCGKEIKNDASFCGNCGILLSGEVNNHLVRISFYSEDWTRKKSLAIASLPYFDVMADEDYLYFIRLPKYHSGAVGLVVGLILFNILGAIIGTIVGNSSDAKKRKAYREAWINSEHKIISNNFEKDILVKIPIKKAKELLSLKKHQIIYSNGNEEIVLRKNKNEVERLNNYLLQNNVL